MDFECEKSNQVKDEKNEPSIFDRMNKVIQSSDSERATREELRKILNENKDGNLINGKSHISRKDFNKSTSNKQEKAQDFKKTESPTTKNRSGHRKQDSVSSFMNNKTLLESIKSSESKDCELLEKVIQEKNEELEKCELERVRLVTDLLRCNSQNTALRRALENDREERKDMETKALKFIKQNKLKYERDACNTISRLQSEIEELNDKLTESHTLNNELSSKYDRTEGELKIAMNEIDRLNTLESMYKEKMSKARQQKRQSIAGVESRLEQIAADSQQQETLLQMKLTEETKSKMELSDKLRDVEVSKTLLEMKLQGELATHVNTIAEMERRIEKQMEQIKKLEDDLSGVDVAEVEVLQNQLKTEQENNCRLKEKVVELEKELLNTTRSFLEHENVISDSEEQVAVLEQELKKMSDEKIELEMKLQELREREDGNKQKMNNLELIFKRLEQGVLKLETENVKLRQQITLNTATSSKLSGEEESKYQQKISFLEDQVEKLEGQLEKLKEKSILDREQHKVTQSNLWKNEKELSDLKIDLRIAKRELRTCEEAAKRLEEELARGRVEFAKEAENVDKCKKECDRLTSELKEKDVLIDKLTGDVGEMEKYKAERDRVRGDLTELEKKCQIMERRIGELSVDKETARDQCQRLELDKFKLESSLEDAKRQISSLELNLNVLKETTAMLDEQLEDFDKFTSNQTKKIEQLQTDKTELEKALENVHNDLKQSRQLVNEEKSFKLKAEHKVKHLERELKEKDDFCTELQKQCEETVLQINVLKQTVADQEDNIGHLESELNERHRIIESLNMDARLTNEHLCSLRSQIYTLKDANIKLNRELEDEQALSDALQDRVEEMENIVRELENFHRQREVKDEATKQQQNKLIKFLQTKLDDCKKKKTLTDKLFGSRSKENTPPCTVEQTPVKEKEKGMGGKSLSKIHKSASRLTTTMSSPRNTESLSQIVKSPASQVTNNNQSLKRMHHNIPHRFKIKPCSKTVTCASCGCSITRGQHASTCVHCSVQAHPKCSQTVPKTCGLPAELVKHYQTALSVGASTASADDEMGRRAGWVKVLRQGRGTWERKYLRLTDKQLLFYENEPCNNLLSPVYQIDLVTGSDDDDVNRCVLIGQVTDHTELPNVARTDVKFVIKVCITQNTTCWPTDTYYLMTSSNSEKLSWLTSLNSVVQNVNTNRLTQDVLSVDKYRGETIYTQQTPRDINCIVQLTSKVLLLACGDGLHSVKLDQDLPRTSVHVRGADSVHDVTISPSINTAVMTVGGGRRLMLCDLRSLVSNCEAAECSQPYVQLSPVTLLSPSADDQQQPCVFVAVSESTGPTGHVYLSAATSNTFFLLRWCQNESKFVTVKTMKTVHPTSCVVFTNSHVIVGLDRYFKLSLDNFVTQELVDPNNRSLAYWRSDSFPINIVSVDCDHNEYLLCYNEFGVFVDGNGERTRHDLKWSSFPCYFAYRKPYLFVFHFSSVEVVKLLPRPSEPHDDTASLASTATLTDTSCLTFNKPKFLGVSCVNKTAIYLSVLNNKNNRDVILIDGCKLNKDDFRSSCFTLSTIPDRDVDEFSFTSSVVQELDNQTSPVLSETESSSESCATYNLSTNKQQQQTKKNVCFQPQHTAM